MYRFVSLFVCLLVCWCLFVGVFVCLFVCLFVSGGGCLFVGECLLVCLTCRCPDYPWGIPE